MKRVLFFSVALLTCCALCTGRSFAQNEARNGKLDKSFSPKPDSNPQNVILLEQGKLLVDGNFKEVGGRKISGIARLNGDGTADPTFNPDGKGTNGMVACIARQSNGKILAIGSFTTYNDTPVGMLIRLNEDGTLDKSFKNDNLFVLDASSCNGKYEWELQLNKILVRPDDSFYVLGGYNRLNGKPAPLIARFTAEGVHDESFLPTDKDIYFKSSPYVDAALLLPSGDIYFGGMFGGYNGSSLNKKLIHITAEGKFDESFARPMFDYGAPRALALKGKDTIIVAGSFYKAFGKFVNLMTAIHLDGTPVEDFNAYDFSDKNVEENEDMINGLVVTDKYLYIGGGALWNAARSFVYPLLPDASKPSEDVSFGTGPNAIVSGLTYDPQGWLYISGFFTSFNGEGKPYFVRCEVPATNTSGIKYLEPTRKALRVAVGEGTFSLKGDQQATTLCIYAQNGRMAARYEHVNADEVIQHHLPAGGYVLVADMQGVSYVTKVYLK